MAKKQLKTQLRKLKTRDIVNKRNGNKTPDRFSMILDPKNSRERNKYVTEEQDYDELNFY